jgi:hypothetical protein
MTKTDRVLAREIVEQRDLGQECIDVRVAVREQGELLEVFEAGAGILQMGSRPGPVKRLHHCADHLARLGQELWGGNLRHQGLQIGQRGPCSPGQPESIDVEVLEASQTVSARCVVPDPSSETGTETIPQLDEAGEGDLVSGVVDVPQMGEHVLDVAMLEETQSGTDPVRDVTPGELDLEVE